MFSFAILLFYEIIKVSANQFSVDKHITNAKLIICFECRMRKHTKKEMITWFHEMLFYPLSDMRFVLYIHI